VTGRYVSLFSGAGGLDLGLLAAGLKPGLLVDADSQACATLRSAVPGAAVMEADIHDVLNSDVLCRDEGHKASYSLVAGAPPVVRGKVYGKQDVHPDDDAPQLLFRCMDAVAQARPSAFIAFGIPVIAGSPWGAVVDRVRREAAGLGYDLFTPVLDASDFGVPQRRSRVALIGMPAGCRPDVSAAPKKNRGTAGAALRALPAGIRDIACPCGVYLARQPAVRSSPYAGQLFNGPGRVTDLRKTAPVIVADLGGNKTPVLDLGQFEHDAVPWVEGYHDYLYRLGGTPGIFDGAEGRMRRLSLRECAALQGFPPGHPFRGPSLGQFRQCGAAVPPALGEAVARAVIAGLA
jgi:DNA (cytosine-5)-methyltransferase 1